MDFTSFKDHLHKAYLLAVGFFKVGNKDEEAALQAWVREHPERRQALVDQLSAEGKQLAYFEADTESAWQRMQIRISNTQVPQPKHMGFRRWPALVSAAAAVLLLVVGGYWGFQQMSVSDTDTFDQSGLSRETTLRLSDGSTMVLDPAQTGLKLVEGVVFYADNQSPVLDPANGEPGQPTSNPTQMLTLNTPIQQLYRVELADGSRVWVNAQTSLTYPQAYTDSIRKVYLEGEAYFEIAKSDKPFIVETKDVKLRVYGTSFNIRAYENETSVETALLSGSVGLTAKNGRGHETRLAPGQSARYDRSVASWQVDTENISELLAWKDGKLFFRKTDLQTVIAQLSQWYGFSFQFEDVNLRKRALTGVAYTDHDLEYTLKLISKSTDVRFYWQQNKLYIK